MQCSDCARYDECLRLGEESPHILDRMNNLSFWGTAKYACLKFKPKEESNTESTGNN